MNETIEKPVYYLGKFQMVELCKQLKTGTPERIETEYSIYEPIKPISHRL